VYRPCLGFWVHCTDIFNFPNVGSTGETKISSVLQVNAPTYVIFSAPVQPVILKYFCLDFFDLDFFTVSSILVLWNHRRCGPSGLATTIFSLSSLEPKSLKMVIFNNHISLSVVCVINRQNIILKYGMRGHFRYSSWQIISSRIEYPRGGCM